MRTDPVAEKLTSLRWSVTSDHEKTENIFWKCKKPEKLFWIRTNARNNGYYNSSVERSTLESQLERSGERRYTQYENAIGDTQSAFLIWTLRTAYSSFWSMRSDWRQISTGKGWLNNGK